MIRHSPSTSPLATCLLIRKQPDLLRSRIAIASSAATRRRVAPGATGSPGADFRFGIHGGPSAGGLRIDVGEEIERLDPDRATRPDEPELDRS